MDFEGYLDALASADATPGGGSAATLVGALATALCAMVARITLAAPRHVEQHPAAAAIVAEADAARRRFLELRPRDEAAYAAVVAAQGRPRSTDDERRERTAQLQRALAGAAAVPLETAHLAAETLDLVARTAGLRNEHLMSDVVCALGFARAALDASIANVEVNHRYLHDGALIAEQAAQLARLRDAATRPLPDLR